MELESINFEEGSNLRSLSICAFSSCASIEKIIVQTADRIELTIYTSQPIDIDYIIYPTTTLQNVSWKIRDNNNNASIDENGIFISNIEGTYVIVLTYSDGETEVSEYNHICKKLITYNIRLYNNFKFD